MVSGWYFSNAEKKFVNEISGALRNEPTFKKCCFPADLVRITPLQLGKNA